MVKVTDKQLDELCKILEGILDDTEVRDAWDVVDNFRSKLEYYDMIEDSAVVIEPEDHPDHPANDPALHPDDYAQALHDYFLFTQSEDHPDHPAQQ